ncbi:MOSC domain-containing protein [Methylophaga sp. UBA2689]|jgi:MOSC domain-containing protein YiiM|uniref:MOSC domain-containing protein n=1 Tax=Methylophaga sp. UBA2689 TaxID=1946878 RepID=UPI0025E8821E|nr:MOSC domain-containing protein [Methylophaga sp. UBA2689]|tara:strand:+ start:1268 stop:1726 length:459 start_codon:yes stop_codon:yes gene_type:complete
MIKAIFTASENLGGQRQVPAIDLVAGKGIKGDRNFDRSQWPGQNITFIELEEINAFNQRFSQQISLSDTRRNVITEGVRLNDLVGQIFRIGDVSFKGVELCEPCSTLGALLQNDSLSKKAVVKAFTHKAGLRADVLSDGQISVGMQIEPVVK